MNAPGPVIIGVDLGTSGPKVAMIDGLGRLIGSEFEPTRISFLPGGGAEQDADEWWSAVLAALRRLLARNLVDPGRISAIGCTAQWAGTVPIDRGGRPLCPAIIWMDSRGAPYIARITGGPIRFEGYGLDKLAQWIWLTGGIPGRSGKDAIAHILWLKHERPEIYRQAWKMLEPKDWLNYCLTGNVAASFCSIGLHWLTDNRDIRRIRYSPRLLRLAGLEEDKLPPLQQAVEVLGTVRPELARELGLPDGIKVILGTPDLHSAAVGSGAVADYQSHLYIGTSSFILCHVPKRGTDLLHNMAALPSPVPGRYLLMNEQETAGACLTFLKRLFFAEDGLGTGEFPPDGFAAFDRVAATVPPGSDRLLFAPWLYGERTPVEDHHLRGAFFNLSLSTTRGHLIRAVLEGVACNSRWLLETVEGFTGRRMDPIRMIGGGARSQLWAQIMADVLDRTIAVVDQPLEANVRGAALLAAAGTGVLPFERFADSVEIARSFSPSPANRRTYDELYAAWRQLYRRNRSLYGRLNA